MLEHACEVLAPVNKVLSTGCDDWEVDVSKLEGFKDLRPVDQDLVRSCFTKDYSDDVEFMGAETTPDPFENIPAEKMVDLAEDSDDSASDEGQGDG